MKAHGSSNDYAFRSAILQCIKMIDGHVVDTIRAGISALEKE